MDTIALSMFADPAAMPSPSSALPSLGGSLFGALVSALAKGEQLPAESPPETALDVAAPELEVASDVPPPFVVRQWLAQSESPPPLSRGLISAPGKSHPREPDLVTATARSLPSPESEEPPAVENADAAGPQLESPGRAVSGEELAEAVEQPIRAIAKTVSSTEDHDPLEPYREAPSAARDRGVPTEPRRIVPPARPVVPAGAVSVELQSPIQSDSIIGRSALETQTNVAADETVALAAPRRPHLNAGPDRPTPSPVVRTTFTAIIRPTIDSPANAPPESTKIPPRAIVDDERACAPNHPKTAHIPDSPKPAEPFSSPPGPVRAPDSLPQPTGNTQTTAANTSAPNPDSISAPALPANLSTAVDLSGETSVKLAVSTREGHTAEMQTLGLHIAARSARGASRFTIRLDPPELGRIDVNLSVTSHGQAQAVLAVEKPQTLDLLLRDAPTLERALKDAGLELGGNLSFSLKEEGRSQFTRDDHYAPPARTLEFVQAESANTNPVPNTSLVEQLYGLRAARLDIIV